MWWTTYERFTDRARKVMQLANQEAQRLNHEYIGTEHILLGLVKEGAGVAANVLKAHDIDLRRIRLAVEEIVQPGPAIVTMGKLPQTPKVKKVIQYAIEEARNLYHNYVGTEHLLLGLLREGENVAAIILTMNLGLKLEDVRREVLKCLGQNGSKDEHLCDEPRRAPPLCAEGEQIRSLEQQLWSVRIVLGVFVGGFIGAQVGAFPGAMWGLVLGGLMPAVGRYYPAALAGAVTGILIDSDPLPGEDAPLIGTVLGLLVGILIAVSFTSPNRYASSILAGVLTGFVLDSPDPPYAHPGRWLCGVSLGVIAAMVTECVTNAIQRDPTRNFPLSQSILSQLRVRRRG